MKFIEIKNIIRKSDYNDIVFLLNYFILIYIYVYLYIINSIFTINK